MSSCHMSPSIEDFSDFQAFPLFPGIPNSFYSPAFMASKLSDQAMSEIDKPSSSDSSATPEAGRSTTGETRAIHMRRSCEVCRASKGRCCPSREDPGRCQKCVKDGKNCVFLEARPRPKRGKTSKTRVAEMEQRLNGIFALLASRSNQSASKELSLPVAPPEFSFPVSGRQEAFTLPRPQSALHGNTPAWMSPFLSEQRFDGVQDVISKGLISFDKAEYFLHNFNANTCNFPFVVIPPQLSLETLRREKPFLLLCILTMSASAYVPLQKLLENEVRECLARKVIINCEKSLDLLQGLMIYVSWYHLYFDPKREQIYQLTQMVIAMAVDLGITTPDGNVNDCLKINDVAFKPRPGQILSELEAKRTFLGCYYMSSCLSFAFRKPSSLKYTDYVETCCQELSDAKEVPSDHLLQYLISLQRLAEDINSAFDYDNHQQLPPLDTVRIEMLTKTFNKQLTQFQETFPDDILENIAVRMSMLYIQIYVNEIGLHAVKPDPLDSYPGPKSCRNWYSSVARNDTLLSCITATKNYLDLYVTLSKEQMHRNTILQEITLVYAVLMLGRFTAGVDSPFLDATYFRESANFAYHITALVNHMSKLVSFTSDGKEQIDLFWHFRRIFQHTKDWFMKQVGNGDFPTLESSGIQDCQEFSFLEILQMDPELQFASETSCPPELTMSHDELWVEAMPEVWPTETLDPRVFSIHGKFDEP